MYPLWHPHVLIMMMCDMTALKNTKNGPPAAKKEWCRRTYCVGALAECRSDIHLLRREPAKSAAMRNWRREEATSVEAAFVDCF